MPSTTQAIPVVRITPTSIVVYYLSTDNFTRSKAQIKNEENLTRGEYNGFMSPKTRCKVKRYLDTWINSIDQIKRTQYKVTLDKTPYLTFVTLTLPSTQKHTDNEIKRECLTPFIETLKRKYNVWNFFWRAEAQENGNIHFHLIIDSFIEWKDLRDDWNTCVNKLGYVDAFEKKHGHNDPNSTDIHGLQDKRSITNYVIKYCCKSDGYRKIDGRIHGCSDSLQQLRPYEFILEVEDYNIIEEAVKYAGSYVHNDVCFTYIGLPVYKFLKAIKSPKLKSMNEYYLDIGQKIYSRKHSSQTLSERSQIRNSTYFDEDRRQMIEVTEEHLQFRIKDFDSY